MNKKTNQVSGGQVAFMGAAVAALAAGAYFFFGPKGKAHQKHAKAWAIKMKGEVVERLENAKDVTESTYNDIVDSVANRYGKSSKVAVAEVQALAKDLKKHWKAIAASVKKSGSKKKGKK